MSDGFHEKFGLALKALSMTRAEVAMRLRVDKSLVGRWATGKAMPSAHNLSRLTALVAERTDRFTMLDWDRDLPGVAALLGVDSAQLANTALALDAPTTGPLGMLIDDLLPTTLRRASAYEGIYRITRPVPNVPGRFIHDVSMVRLEAEGLMNRIHSVGGYAIEARLLAKDGQLIMLGVEVTSRSPVMALMNGVTAMKADRTEGLLLYCLMDATRTPVVNPFISERIADLQGDRQADDATFAGLAHLADLAPEGSVPPEIAAHLFPDVGPAAFAAGGDMVLSLPIGRSLARAADFV